MPTSATVRSSAGWKRISSTSPRCVRRRALPPRSVAPARNAEFLAADAAEDVALRMPREIAAANRQKRRIAGEVAEIVVDRIEVIRHR